ncbi:MAG TPA: MFS transporter [Terriglobales bacterium]|nr:MFS transporter [Terriglobales bacterium]
MQTETSQQAATTRNVYVLGITSLLNDTASEMAYWILPAFLLTLGAGPVQLGLIEGLAESSASFIKLFSGRLTDRLPRRKPLVVLGYTIANVVKPVLAIATSWWQVLIIRFADRAAKGLRGAPRDVMLAESTEKGRMGAAFGLLQAMDSAGAILGPLVAVLMLDLLHSSMRKVFWIAAIPGFLTIAVVALFARETRTGRTAEASGATYAKADSAEKKATQVSNSQLMPQPESQSVVLPVSFYYVLAAVTLFSLGNSSDMFLILRAQNIGIPVAYAPLLGLAFNFVYTLVAWPAGKISDKVSKPVVAAVGYLVFAAVYLTFAAAPSRAAIWAAMTGYGVYYSLTDPVLRALVVETIAPEARGRALGIFFFVTSIATLLASLLTGELWKHFGAALPFYLSGGLAIVAAAMLLLRGKKFVNAD